MEQVFYYCYVFNIASLKKTLNASAPRGYQIGAQRTESRFGFVLPLKTPVDLSRCITYIADKGTKNKNKRVSLWS